MTSTAVRFALWLLKRPLTLSDRNLLSTAVLERLGALPLHASLSISSETGEVLVNGKPLEIEHARMLAEGAKALAKNPVFKLLWDQIAYNAIGFGVHKAENESQMFFARAALWWGQEERRIISELSGEPL